MLYAIIIFVCVVLGTATLLLTALKMKRIYALVSFPLLSLLILYLMTTALGIARPSLLVFGSNIQVISVTYIQGKAIYITGTVTGSQTPILIQFPWSEEEAKKIAGAQQQLGKIEIELDALGNKSIHPQHTMETKE